MSDASVDLNARLADGPVTLDRDVSIDYPLTVAHGLDLGGHRIRLNSDGRDLTYPGGKNDESDLRARAAIRLQLDAWLRNGKIIGTNTAAIADADLEAQHGVVCAGGNLVEDIKVRNVWGDTLYARGDDITVRRFVGSGAGRNGLGHTHGARLLVEDSTFRRTAKSVVNLEPWATGGEIVTETHIRRCLFGSHRIGPVIGSGGTGDVHGVLIEDSRSTGPFTVLVDGPGAPGEPYRRTNIHCHRLVGSAPWNRPTFTFDRVAGIEVRGCVQPFSGKLPDDFDPVAYTHCVGVVVEGNTFPRDPPG